MKYKMRTSNQIDTLEIDWPVEPQKFDKIFIERWNDGPDMAMLTGGWYTVVRRLVQDGEVTLDVEMVQE